MEKSDSFYDYLAGRRYDNRKDMINPIYYGMEKQGYGAYQGGMEFPTFTLYGYEDSEEDDKDWEYMKYMYPKVGKLILKEIEEECDKLEYEGSCMFDQYPDRIRLGMITNNIYGRLKNLEEKTGTLEPENVEATQQNRNRNDCRRGRCPRWPSERPGGYGRESWLRDLIEIMLYNEMVNRRRRRRNRRRR